MVSCFSWDGGFAHNISVVVCLVVIYNEQLKQVQH